MHTEATSVSVFVYVCVREHEKKTIEQNWKKLIKNKQSKQQQPKTKK